MSKIIYLDSVTAKEQTYRNYTEEFTDILVNFFNSINKKFIIYLINYLFSNTIKTTSELNFELNNEFINSTDINLDKNNFSINFSIKNELNAKYSFQIQNDLHKPFTITLLRYLKKKPSNFKKDIIINIPDARIIKFNNINLTTNVYNYIIQMFNHTLTYKIPILKYYEKEQSYIEYNKLFILIPFNIFTLQEEMIKIRKSTPEKTRIKTNILKTSLENSNYINDLYSRKIITFDDYTILNNFIKDLSIYLQNRFI